MIIDQEFWDKQQQSLGTERSKWERLQSTLLSMVKDCAYPQEQYTTLEDMMRLCSGHLGWLQAKQVELDTARRDAPRPDSEWLRR